METKKKNNKVWAVIKEIIPYVVILVTVVLVRTYLVTPVIVSGDSMNPTLKGGEIMILNKRATIKKGSIIVAKYKKEEIIKRVIAMPGETISCENGKVFVNDHLVEEDFIQGVTPDFERITLGDDEYYIMGDNRSNSLDSTELGPFKREKIKGTTKLVIFPFTKIGKVK
jgi:signal peptidase I